MEEDKIIVAGSGGAGAKLAHELATKYPETILIHEPEIKNFKISNTYKDLPIIAPGTVCEIGKKRGSNFTPPKKKRKK